MSPTLPSSKRAVAAAFVLNGVLMASLISRIPDLRAELDLDNGALGLLLLAGAFAYQRFKPEEGEDGEEAVEEREPQAAA